jgi:pimeloyl-ACP methyl ester carboxylesterase
MFSRRIDYCSRFFILILFLILARNLHAGDLSGENHLNITMPTMGGKQFWADELFFHKWRIQRNVFSGHCRLLDERNHRHAWGTFDQCRAALERIKQERHLPPMHGKAVIVLHGLFRSRSSMASLSDYLAQHGKFDEVFNVTYPTTRCDIAEHARSLAKIINNLESIEEVDFVAHSMGNIVIRYYLGDLQRQRNLDNIEAVGGNALPDKHPKFNRFVMLAPPNHEAQIATFLGDNILFMAVVGESGQQLGRQWEKLENKLATPDFEFAIIAGGKSDGKGFNPLFTGDNDGTILLESTKLPGARDFVVVPVLHSFIMNNAQVQEYTLRFLQQGYFLSEQQRQALEK